MGAEGGGFVINRGVNTTIEVEKTIKRKINVYINKKEAPEALTTRSVVNKMLDIADSECKVEVRHDVNVPIGAGYGSSAAGALSTALALARLFDSNMNENDLAMIAHTSEIECGTGLGTVACLLVGGCVLQRGCGGPGISTIDNIPIEKDVKIISVYFGPIYTKRTLSNPSVMKKVAMLGEEAMDRIHNHPDLKEFMKESRLFSSKLGLQTPRVIAAIEEMESTGAIGATQNMIGEAVHGAFHVEDINNAVKALKKKYPESEVLSTGIYLNGD
jgi:pantoate kinase